MKWVYLRDSNGQLLAKVATRDEKFKIGCRFIAMMPHLTLWGTIRRVYPYSDSESVIGHEIELSDVSTKSTT